MPNTYRTAVPHVLIRGKGKYHAGYELAPETMGFKTACGESIQNAIAYPADILARLITENPEAICKRCDRVGASIDRD